MLNVIGKVLATSLIPTAVNRFFNWFDSEPSTKPKVKQKRRPSDMHKFNVEQFRTIKEEYRKHTEYNLFNPKDKNTLVHLTDKLNEMFGYTKSQTAYSRVWNNHTEESNCIVGEVKCNN